MDKVMLARAEVAAVLDALNAHLEDDEQFKLDTLEGETSLFEVARALLDANEQDEGQVLALSEQIENRKSRMDRAVHRQQRRREALLSLMEAARLTKLPLPEATLSVRTLQPRLKVVDVEQLPSAYLTTRIIHEPNKETLKDAPPGTPGTAMTNGGVSLTVRRK